MTAQDYLTLKLTCGVICTIALYTVLFRENRLFRLFEHLFLGLAAGWMLVVLWAETLREQWWLEMVGEAAQNGAKGREGHWAFVMLLPLGLMGYFVFSRKHNWMSRIPIGVILGLWSGQQIDVWFRRYGSQIADTMKPVIPTTWDQVFVPSREGLSGEALAAVTREVYLSQAVSNLIFVVTVICSLAYFFYGFDVKGKLMGSVSTTGRWLLMIGFGAIFGSTVMMRFSLMIDRMYFVWIEWFRDTILKLGGG
jgi:hypothetical protein